MTSKIIGGKRYYESRVFKYKDSAQKYANQLRKTPSWKHGSIRVMKTEGGWGVYTH